MVRLTTAFALCCLFLSATVLTLAVTRPAPAADVTVLAINREGDTNIYAKDATHRITHRLTHAGTFNGIPQISPDGGWIAFISNRTGNTEVYVMDRFGGAVRNLSQHTERDHNPYWTDDSRYVRFSSERDVLVTWYVADIHTGELRLLADTDIPTPGEERACRSSSAGGAWSTCNRGDDEPTNDNALP